MHAGLSPATPIFDYQDGDGQYGYNPNVAGDAAGTTMLAWYSAGSARRGVLAQQVSATGAPVAGGAATMPGTGGMRTGMIGLTPLVARAGGGFYAAYPVGGSFLGRNIMLWRIGDGRRAGSRAPAVRAPP